MASNQTQHLKLSQWEADDEVLRSDFNADNAKIDAAVGELAETCDGLTARCGNCVVVAGFYVGNGVSGPDSPTTLTFDHRVVLLLVGQYVMVHGVQHAHFYSSNYYHGVNVTWADKSVSWCGETAAMDQCNENGTNYHYVAFLDAEH